MERPIRLACQARAAGHEVHAGEVAHPGRVERDAVEVDVALDLEHARADRVADRAGLLEDLLLHEAVVAALLRLDRVPLHLLALALDRRAVEGGDRDAVRVTRAISPSCRIWISRVYGIRVGMSLATKFSPLPWPTTIGFPPFFAIRISPGVDSSTTAIAHEPSSRRTAARTAWSNDCPRLRAS